MESVLAATLKKEITVASLSDGFEFTGILNAYHKDINGNLFIQIETGIHIHFMPISQIIISVKAGESQ